MLHRLSVMSTSHLFSPRPEMQRELLPAMGPLDADGSAKLAVVGIGSLEAARDYADALGLPRDVVFADEGAVTHRAVGTVNSDFEENALTRGKRMLSMETWRAVVRRRGGRRVSIGPFDVPALATNNDLEAVKPGAGIYKEYSLEGDQAADRSLVLGGALVFNGVKLLMAHYDQAPGAHADIEWVVGAAKARAPGQPQKLLAAEADAASTAAAAAAPDAGAAAQPEAEAPVGA
ncbi:unnamed protein product [Prorocentrum cordatum]|uniref:Phosphoglycerate kinase n=2 Tax=Prorocentrum cordatum TaxID=2364126 RepID=A0ABN9Y106_9DINO|nr:unnamed protein product [Polarella glacialis]